MVKNLAKFNLTFCGSPGPLTFSIDISFSAARRKNPSEHVHPDCFEGDDTTGYAGDDDDGGSQTPAPPENHRSAAPALKIWWRVAWETAPADPEPRRNSIHKSSARCGAVLRSSPEWDALVPAL